MAPFHIIDIFDDVDDMLYAFEQLYTEILNEDAPLKQAVIRRNQVPYITEEWRKEIRYRNKQWKKFTRNRTNTNYDLYKIQRNKCTVLKRKAIKQYFLKKSTEPERPQEFWNAYRPFLHGKTKQANDIVFKDNGAVIFGRQQRVKIGDTVSAWSDVKRGVPQRSVLGPRFFNIFIDDLFHHITRTKLNVYADDHQIYHSSIDPCTLGQCVIDQVEVANLWYHNNWMIVNETKHKL